MEFPKISQENKELNWRFLKLFLRQEEEMLSPEEQFELKKLSASVRRQRLRIPATRLSARELAQCLMVSYYQVKKWIESGKIPAIRLATGRYQLTSSQIYYPLLDMGYELF